MEPGRLASWREIREVMSEHRSVELVTPAPNVAVALSPVGADASVKSSIGSLFYERATRPLREMRSCADSEDAAGVLVAVEHERLEAAVVAAVARVVRNIRCNPEAIHRVVQSIPLGEALADVEAARRRAADVLTTHQTGVAGVASQFGGAILDAHLGGVGFGSWVASRVNRYVQGTRLSGPLTELGTCLLRYDQCVAHCAQLLDADAQLGLASRDAVRRRNRSVALSTLTSIGNAVLWVFSPVGFFVLEARGALFLCCLAAALTIALIRNAKRRAEIRDLSDEYTDLFDAPAPRFSAAGTRVGSAAGAVFGHPVVAGFVGAAVDLARNALGRVAMSPEQKALHDRIKGLQAWSPFLTVYLFLVLLSVSWVAAFALEALRS
jgi:hypothetical protein